MNRGIFLLAAVAAQLVAAEARAEKGVSACLKLKQNCEAYVARELSARAHIRSDQSTIPHGYHLSSQRCEQQYASARSSGRWPSYNGMPELPCKN
jgi:hypothetical protein